MHYNVIFYQKVVKNVLKYYLINVELFNNFVIH